MHKLEKVKKYQLRGKMTKIRLNGIFYFWTSYPKVNRNHFLPCNPVLLPQNTCSILFCGTFLSIALIVSASAQHSRGTTCCSVFALTVNISRIERKMKETFPAISVNWCLQEKRLKQWKHWKFFIVHLKYHYLRVPSRVFSRVHARVPRGSLLHFEPRSALFIRANDFYSFFTARKIKWSKTHQLTVPLYKNFIYFCWFRVLKKTRARVRFKRHRCLVLSGD